MPNTKQVDTDFKVTYSHQGGHYHCRLFLKQRGQVTWQGGGGRWAGLLKYMFSWAIVVGRNDDRNGISDRWRELRRGRGELDFLRREVRRPVRGRACTFQKIVSKPVLPKKGV